VSAVLENKKYTGTPETVIEIFKVAFGPNGSQSWALRKYIEDIIKHVRPRDYWSEALAVYFETCGLHFRYTHDPQSVELIKSPEKMIAEIQARGVTLGDCDDLATFILSSLSVIGIPSRIGTGAFDINPELWPQLGMERPEKFGIRAMAGTGFAGGPFTHVWAEGLRPDGVWVILDPVAGPDSGQMKRRLRQVRYYLQP